MMLYDVHTKSYESTRYMHREIPLIPIIKLEVIYYFVHFNNKLLTLCF